MKALWLVLVSLVVVALVGGAVFAVTTFISTENEAASANSAPVEDDDDFGSVEVYTVTDGELEPAASGLTAEVWETFVRVATPEVAASIITEYRVGDAPDSDTLAYVYQSGNPDYWILADNLATSTNRTDLIGTLVHEYAHILTLGVDQVTPHYASCDTLILDEGCADPGSAIDQFEARFWEPYGDAAPAVDNSDSDVAYDFYLAHEDDFVDDYAATNAVEDIAETFMTWVVQDDTAGTSAVADKFAFLATYPELVEVRDRIRAEFRDELGLAS